MGSHVCASVLMIVVCPLGIQCSNFMWKGHASIDLLLFLQPNVMYCWTRSLSVRHYLESTPQKLPSEIRPVKSPFGSVEQPEPVENKGMECV